jgi:hypothetical protein
VETIMKRVPPGIASLLLLATVLGLALPLPARAAQGYDNCTGFIDTVPATISTQGTWCLRRDLGTSITGGNAIAVNANNVTIDCNDFKVGGLAAGTGTIAGGIRIDGRFNSIIRNCNIRGFAYGIVATADGGGHLIEHNNLDGNTYYAIIVASPGSTIRSNRVLDTGGSTTRVGAAYGIYAMRGTDVVDNTVNGVAATPTDSGYAAAYGIFAHDNDDASVAGNRIRGLAGAGPTYGIYSQNSSRLVVRDNDLQGSGGVGSSGVYCGNNQATARDNVIAGFATGIQDCLSSNNTVNTN